MTTYTYVGKPIGRIEGPAKVTGGAHFAADILLPGMLWAKALRSPMPHARILNVDTSRARRLPGVRAVLSAADVSPALMGRRMLDMPILARDRVRFIGEKVAVVAADDPDTAEEALLLIDVQYEELPAVFDPLEALKPGAPILHDQINSYQGLPQPVQEPTNLFNRITIS
jgi:CO/xanthine dehydrogenase Mo-binding subunit